MKTSELLWNIDLWLLEFEGEIDAYFGAGDIERGLSAYRSWHEHVRRAIARIDSELAAGFTRTAANVGRIDLNGSASLTPRTIFMRTCGGRSKRFLTDLKRKAVNGTLKTAGRDS
jgi:hypothetical protein